MGNVNSSEEVENLQSINNVSVNEEEQSGNTSSNFIDNSPEAIEARRLQESADNSEETVELQKVQDNATAHDKSVIGQQNPKKRKREQDPKKKEEQEVPQKKKKKPDPEQPSLKDYVNKKPEHDPGKLSDKQLQATLEYTKWKKKFVSKEKSRYSETELLLACRLTIRELREKGAAPKSIVQLGAQYLKQAKKQGVVADKAIGFEGKLKWGPQSLEFNNTEFGKWILEKGPEPNKPTSNLNCWELVLYSAFKGGVLKKARILTLYKKFTTDFKATGSVPTAAKSFDMLKKGSEYIYNKKNLDTPKPIKGDLVIFKDFPTHVTIATGNITGKGEVEIMSLWTQNNKNTYKTTIQGLLDVNAKGPVKFFTPNW